MGAVFALACGLMAACSSLPARKVPLLDGSGVVQTSPVAVIAEQVTVHGRDGPLSTRAQARSLAAVRAEGEPALVTHHLGLLAAQGDVDLYRGNATRLLVDGPATFAAMKAAIQRARGRVLLESYIVEDAGIAAEIAALLLRKAAEGVSVAMIYDAVGSIGTDTAYFDALRAGGVAVCAFNPLNPLQRPGYWNINHRDHRKLLVVDEDYAFTGGINISRVYSSGSFGSRKSGGTLDDGWRDTQIEMRGPVVTALARTFAETWTSQGCQGVLGRAAAPTAQLPGQRVVKVLASDPADDSQRENRIYRTLLAALDGAQRSVHLTMAYFAPGRDMVDALSDAARRGVEVVLVLPGSSDFPLVLHAGRSYYQELMDAGVAIHEMVHANMHAKTAVIDGVFATVGSSNMDWRSFVDNSEINVVVLGEDFGREMEALFQRDVAVSPRITPAAWRERGLKQRLMETVGRLTERWL
ncbi:MAG: cardiolipin synthase B [Chitinophagaceae bacterium]|nr:cardiolipin synthase B [Rubrivivax sp.]